METLLKKAKYFIRQYKYFSIRNLTFNTQETYFLAKAVILSSPSNFFATIAKSKI